MYSLSNNEDGFVLVTAMMVLVMLTLIGTAALNTTTMEFQITGNDIRAKRNFYIAEATAMEAAQWLETQNAQNLRNRDLDLDGDGVDDGGLVKDDQWESM